MIVHEIRGTNFRDTRPVPVSTFIFISFLFWLYIFNPHFYFLLIISVIDSFYKFPSLFDGKALLIIYMLEGAIVNLYIIITIIRFTHHLSFHWLRAYS